MSRLYILNTLSLGSTVNYYDAMDMVRHNNEFIQANFPKMVRNLQPKPPGDRPNR